MSVALITGATSGIGREVARLFAEMGINLIVSGRCENELALLQKELSKKVDVRTVQADLASSQGRELLVEVVHARLPDIVINNAGFGLYGEALTYSTQEQLEVLEVNGKAVLQLTLEAGHALVKAKKKGIILNVSSAAAFQVIPNSAVYAASKAFVNNFSLALDFEYRAHGIRVLTLCPGMVATQFQRRAGGLDEDSGRKFGVMQARYVAEQIRSQIQSSRPLLIIDWKVRLMTHLSQFFPIPWIAKLLGKIIAKRIKTRR